VTVPAAMLATVFACDLLRDRTVKSRALIGALDEVAHLATTSMVLLATRDPSWLRERRADVRAALASTVLIDMDHIRPPTGSSSVFRGGRPFTHSLATVVTALAGSGVAPTNRWKQRLAATATGLALHFGRDVATGRGMMLWWPVSSEAVKVHYCYYAVACVAAAVSAAVRMAQVPPARSSI
jgi:inner membrane protein